MSNPDTHRPPGDTITECLLLAIPWFPTLFVILAGDQEIAPLFGTVSGALDVVLLAIFREMRS